MQQEQIKTLVVNIMTGAVVVGVIVVGYFVFTKKDTAITSSVASVARVAEETASIGTEIDYTVRDLKDLERAVASSKVIFDLPEFKNLQDFSVAIPAESIGRTNPFVLTEWKIKIKALEQAVGKSGTSQSGTQSASVSVTQQSTQSQIPTTSTQSTISTQSTPPDLLGDFPTGGI